MTDLRILDREEILGILSDESDAYAEHAAQLSAKDGPTQETLLEVFGLMRQVSCLEIIRDRIYRCTKHAESSYQRQHGDNSEVDS